MNLKKIACLALSAITILSLGACGKKTDTSAEKPLTVVKLGVVGEYNDYWDVVKEKVKAKGIDLQYVKFSDYSLPNQALADGEIDMNAFQHYAFLNKQIETFKYELTPICNTIIAPLGIYSQKNKDLKSFKEGDKIAIPNDPTNCGRSLKLIEAAGLITVDPEKGFIPEIKDVTANPLKLEFVPVEAAQTASLLPDVAAAIINGGHAISAKLDPNKDAIYLEQALEGTDNPYINVLVVKTADKDNENYKTIAEATTTPEVAKKIEELYKGAFKPAF
ncbi:MAG: MetQ/NlpA family ABC transporter substrate-binding protein [Oscillospiraceae bacterium]